MRASQPKDELWQDEQVMFSAPDSRGSKNSALPSAAFSGVYGLLAGNGISAGRLYPSRDAGAWALAVPVAAPRPIRPDRTPAAAIPKIKPDRFLIMLPPRLPIAAGTAQAGSAWPKRARR